MIGMLLLGQMIGLASAEPAKPVQVLKKIELIEIADHGGGVSPAKYFERITMDEPAQNSPIGEPLNREQVAQYALKNRLPIQSKLLTPGRVQSRHWKKHAFMTAAIALVGYDKASVQWLKMKKRSWKSRGP
ncbi:MAG: integrating conjugative element protein [gamma proteobacterium symbiont of Lucinoma myriamae]|nr:integrating conjugative element protein [gamma proteobacterium symbiont of Lucinoma myriamae]MCU7833206.1 integrating conjugative element protein [gamma proteobacterium symbiont of Lucinoma myriamae]